MSADARRLRRVVSILVPVYNEEDNLLPFYGRLDRALRGLSTWQAEIIFVDDGSRDGSFPILEALHGKDPRVKILRLSRNFGSMSAVLAGLHAASGDAVAWMSSDMQDPPELIPLMLQRLEDAADVVWAVRTERHDPWLRRVAALLFYRLLQRVALPSYPATGTDICLMDRRVARLFGQLREHNRFTQGLIMSLGFRQATVPYTREKRHKGRSKSDLPRLLKFGIDMIASFSYFPIRLMSYVGLATFIAAVGVAIGIAVRQFVFHAVGGGWVWLLLIVCLFGSLNLIMLGVLGEYVWRVLDEVRDRPQYIVRERVGFEPAGAEPVKQIGYGHS